MRGRRGLKRYPYTSTGRGTSLSDVERRRARSGGGLLEKEVSIDSVVEALYGSDDCNLEADICRVNSASDGDEEEVLHRPEVSLLLSGDRSDGEGRSDGSALLNDGARVCLYCRAGFSCRNEAGSGGRPLVTEPGPGPASSLSSIASSARLSNRILTPKNGSSPPLLVMETNSRLKERNRDRYASQVFFLAN